MKSRALLLLSCIAVLSACSGGKKATSAANPDQSFENWQVATVKGKQGTCYAVTPPAVQEDSMNTRGKVYLMVTRLADGEEQVSASPGYALKVEDNVWFTAGKQRIDMRARNAIAWAEDTQGDEAMLERLLRVQRVSVRTETAHGDTTRDIYDTKGLTEALERVRELCP